MQVPERLFGHEPTLDGLWSAAGAMRLPHALLFEGPEGVGKFATALRLAAGLLCSKGPGAPCGSCPPCKRVGSGGWRGNHPDLFVIDPEEESAEEGSKRRTLAIPVHRIAVRSGADSEGTSAQEFLGLLAVEAGWRIVLVREAHLMAAPAQNALLKTLEEPGENTLLVLVSGRSGKLLPTIKSRCARVRFGRISRDETAELLRGAGVPGELARWSGGAPGEALRLHREDAATVRSLIAGVLNGDGPPLEAAHAVWGVEGEYPGPTPTAQARARARSVLDLGAAILLDVLRHGEGCDAESLAHGDLAAALVPRIGPTGAARALERVLELRSAAEGNATPEVAVERCLLALAEAGVVGSPCPSGSPGGRNR